MKRNKHSVASLAIACLLALSPELHATELSRLSYESHFTANDLSNSLTLEAMPAKSQATSHKAKAKSSRKKAKTKTKHHSKLSKHSRQKSSKTKSRYAARSKRHGSGRGYSYEPINPSHHTPQLVRSVMEHGQELLGYRYRSTGIAPWALDCSGFVKYIFSLEGIKIPHSSAALSMYTSRQSDPKPGDLVFFRGSNRASSRIGHVGMVVSNKGGDLKMIHSSSSKGIVIESITNSAYYSSRYMGAGRLPQLASHWENLPDSLALR